MVKRTLIKEEDLVLKISSSYESKNFRIDKYSDFIDRLCWTREYQKEAIKNACIFLLWWRYKNTLELAQENYNSNETLQDKYKKFSDFGKKLRLKDKLSCNIDLATWTWKSFVIYGIAQIMLCEWKIDKVLVLAPSVTIEEWLTKKFKELASNKDLIDLLPPDSYYKNPKIIQATQTLEAWSICIENIHSTYKNTKSAIEDSVVWVWEKTLVLNDEAHHIFSWLNKDLKEWYKFLSDKKYNFKYIVWFTWTPYIENEYFTDIIYRYSILQWMEQKFIKKVDYVKDTDKSLDTNERMQIILQNHNENQKKYNKIKPITIFVSKDIKHCVQDRKNIIDFLHKQEWTKKEILEKQVLIVTSDKKHAENLDILKTVWSSKNPVQWICSVAMLTEGWDVPNVFQIVPSEEKAFNSKLLISQVIWRWLRIPEEYKWEDLSVTILNHTKFKEDISHLVDEILEVEEKIYSYPIKEKEKYSFPIYNIEYSEKQIETSLNTNYKAPTFKDSVSLFSDNEEEDVKITYWTLWSEEEKEKVLTVYKETKTIDELANEIDNKIKAWCLELESEWVNEEEIEKLEKYDFNFIKNYIQKWLEKKWLDSEKISKANALKIMQWFWIIYRFWSKSVSYEKEPSWIIELDIFDENNWIWKTWVSLSTIKKWKAFVFYDENSEKYSNESDKETIDFLKWEIWPKYFINILNSTLNKTPLNINIASSWPEKDFINLLINEKYNDFIDWFFKSKDRWFYDLEYRWLQWSRTPKIWKFNPDFFIKSGNKILVIEIKWKESEKEYSRWFSQNKAKYLQAKEHFEALNKALEKKWINQKYYFHFCSPKDYKILFDYLAKNKLEKYTSRLEASYEESSFKDIQVKELEFFDNTQLKKVFWASWDNLEEKSQIFLTTAEKNYFDNKETKNYNFSWWELVKAFELELRTKIFEKIRDDEDIAYKIMEEENNNFRNNQKFKTIDYFEYSTENLDLWTMQHLLTFNQSLIDYIKTNFKNFPFEIGRNQENYNLVQNKNFNSIDSSFYRDLPNTIWLIREKFRNADSHWWKVFKKEELEELREIMLYWEGILVKLVNLFNKIKTFLKPNPPHAFTTNN